MNLPMRCATAVTSEVDVMSILHIGTKGFNALNNLIFAQF